jgi:hypothetical protein
LLATVIRSLFLVFLHYKVDDARCDAVRVVAAWTAKVSRQRRGPRRTIAAKLRTIGRQFSCEKVPKLGLFVKIQLTRVSPGAAPQGGGARHFAYLVLGKAGPVLVGPRIVFQGDSGSH